MVALPGPGGTIDGRFPGKLGAERGLSARGEGV